VCDGNHHLERNLYRAITGVSLYKADHLYPKKGLDTYGSLPIEHLKYQQLRSKVKLNDIGINLEKDRARVWDHAVKRFQEKRRESHISDFKKSVRNEPATLKYITHISNVKGWQQLKDTKGTVSIQYIEQAIRKSGWGAYQHPSKVYFHGDEQAEQEYKDEWEWRARSCRNEYYAQMNFDIRRINDTHYTNPWADKSVLPISTPRPTNLGQERRNLLPGIGSNLSRMRFIHKGVFDTKGIMSAELRFQDFSDFVSIICSTCRDDIRKGRDKVESHAQMLRDLSEYRYFSALAASKERERSQLSHQLTYPNLSLLRSKVG